MHYQPTASAANNRPGTWSAVVVLIAVVSSLTGLSNEWAQDDIPLIRLNPLIQDLGHLPGLFTGPYWPPPFTPALYRPLASVTFAFEWAVGGGSPLVVRLVSYFLYGLVAWGVYALARRHLPVVVAGLTGALFAAHPVHVESVALGVNQSELWVGLLACVATIHYVKARSAGGPIRARDQLLLGAVYLAACLFKENALVIPGLLIAAEILLVPPVEPVRKRVAHCRQLVLLLAMIGVAFLWVRTRVLSGSVSGTFVADGLLGLTMGERAVAMLAVVPEWFRLLFWPVHLRADYGPQEFTAQLEWGLSHTLGLLLLVGSVAAAVVARRRAPMVSFGIVWCAIALFPVHNVLVPTGILLAERILFLPSIGAMLALGGIGVLLLENATQRRRTLLGAASLVLLMGGMLRSMLRHPVLYSQFKLWYVTANEDAPKSFLAHEALADLYFNAGLEGMAEQEHLISIHLTPPNLTRTRVHYADRLRHRGFCYPAIDLYRQILQVRPDLSDSRLALTACLLDVGRYREAMFQARMGMSFGWAWPTFRQAIAKADSGLRISAPEGTVRLIVPETDSIAAPLVAIGTKK